MAAREHRHQVRDIAVRLFRDGAGEPVLFLHGGGGVPAWNPFFEKLARLSDRTLRPAFQRLCFERLDITARPS